MAKVHLIIIRSTKIAEQRAEKCHLLTLRCKMQMSSRLLLHFSSPLTATAHRMHTEKFSLTTRSLFALQLGRVDDDGLKILLERSKTCQLSAFDILSHLFVLLSSSRGARQNGQWTKWPVD